MPSRRAKPSKQEIYEAREAIWPEDDACPLCGRTLVKGPTVNEHHLVPRMYGGTKKYAIHRICHSKIHSLFTEKDLALVFNTFEKLREHEAVAKFVRWVRKQDPEFMDRHVRPAGW